MPRIQTAMGRSGQTRYTYSCFDFSGGLDVATQPYKMAVDPRNSHKLIEAVNLQYSVDGSVATRPGFGLKTDTITSETILGGAYYKKSSVAVGTAKDVVTASDGHFYEINGGSFVSKASGLAATARRSSFDIYNDVLYLATGQDPLKQWDGTTFSSVGGSSPTTPKQVVVHANRMFAMSSAMGLQSRLYWSKLNNPADWSGTDDAGFMDVTPNDGGILVSLVPIIQELGMLKTYRPYRLQGIGPVTGYTVADSLAPANGSIGSMSPQATIFAGNNVWYMSQMGAHTLAATDQFGDLTAGLASDRVEPYFRAFSYVPYSFSAYSPYDQNWYQQYGENGLLDAPMMGHHLGGNLILFGQKATSNSNGVDRWLVFNLRLNNWAVWYVNGTQIFQEYTCIWPSIAAGSPPTPSLKFGVYSSVSDKSAVVELSSMTPGGIDNTMDDGNLATPFRATHLSALGAPATQKCPRHLYLYFSESSVSTTVGYEITYDFADTPQVTGTFDIHSASNSESQIVKRIDLGAHLCETMMLRIKCDDTKAVRWQGYEVIWSPRRSIRRAE